MISQSSPERDGPARLNPPRGPVPTIGLPRGLRLMLPGSLPRPIEENANLITSTEGNIIGIQDARGVLRPLFYHRMMVKVKSIETRSNSIMPLTLREYMAYNYNSDMNVSPHWIAQHIEELRVRNIFD